MDKSIRIITGDHELQRKERELRRTHPHLPTGRRYYDYDGSPAYQTGFHGTGYKVQDDGTHTEINLATLHHAAQPCDRQEFERLFKQAKSRHERRVGNRPASLAPA